MAWCSQLPTIIYSQCPSKFWNIIPPVCSISSDTSFVGAKWSHDFGCGLGVARNAGVLGVAIAGVLGRTASKSILGDATAVSGCLSVAC
jgi:hypothetical protein